MHFKSLKANITVNVAILLIISIGMTDFVLVRFIENRLIESNIESMEQSISSGDENYIEKKFVCAVFIEPDGVRRIHGNIEGLSEHEIALMHRRALEVADGSPVVRFAGDGWGIFWKQSKYLIVASARPHPGSTGLIVSRLDTVYEPLREAHHLALFFLAINFFLLWLFGSFRLSRMVTRPIHRLIRTADAYQPEDRLDIVMDKQTDEFGKLSSAVNRMLQRIKNDNLKLQRSIEDIESANLELKQAQKEIIRAEKLASIGRLSAGLAHEIGNPIGVVLGYLGLIRKRCISPGDLTAADYINRAESEINRINVIIRQLLDFSRAEKDNSEIFSMHDLMADVAQMISQQPLTGSTEISFGLAASESRVLCDYNQLHQVIVNLLINATDSISELPDGRKGHIHLATKNIEKDTRFLQLEISDNGCGIPEDCLSKIFDPFFTTKDTGKGTGLGLSVCYMIIERLEGTIEVQSEVNKGTKVIIDLPLVDGLKRLETGPGLHGAEI